MRTALGRARRLVTFLVLAFSAWWLLVRRRSAALPWAAPPAGLPAEPGRPGEVPADVLATDAGLTEVPSIFAPSERLDVAEPDELATDAGLTEMPRPAAASDAAPAAAVAAGPVDALPVGSSDAEPAEVASSDAVSAALLDAEPADAPEPGAAVVPPAGSPDVAAEVAPSGAVSAALLDAEPARSSVADGPVAEGSGTTPVAAGTTTDEDGSAATDRVGTADAAESDDTTIVLAEAVVEMTSDGDEVIVVEDVVMVTELDVPEADADAEPADADASADTTVIPAVGVPATGPGVDPAARGAAPLAAGRPGTGPAFSDLGGRPGGGADRETPPVDRSGVDEPTAVIPRPPTIAPLVPSIAFNEAPTMEVPAVTDNLRALRGIGPSMERMLHSLGIVSFRQLALLDGDELQRVRDELRDFRTRIEREDWIGQARALHKEKYGTDPS